MRPDQTQPVSVIRRRAAAESGHIRLLPVTKGQRCACRQPAEHHVVSRLISELTLKIKIENLVELEPRYEIGP